MPSSVPVPPIVFPVAPLKKWIPEPPLPRSSAIESIEVLYKPLDFRVLGWGIHWVIVFFLLSIVAGFALRRPFGVEI